jgi:hypothetical protein
VPIELPRGALDLSIYLPTGSEPGKYQIEIVEQPEKPLINAEGKAALRDHIAAQPTRLPASTVAGRMMCEQPVRINQFCIKSGSVRDFRQAQL